MIKLVEVLNTVPGIEYHLENNLSLHDNIYRYSSDAFVELFAEARKLLKEGAIQLSKEDLNLLETTDIGEYGIYEGEKVPLDLPMVDEAEYRGRDVQLNKPKRGGPKKFFGDSGNLSVKINEPGARASFAARHQCHKKKDKTKPGYWSCNVGRYWKSLGGSRNFSGYW
jgi:hypothetical protein